MKSNMMIQHCNTQHSQNLDFDLNFVDDQNFLGANYNFLDPD